MGKDDKKEEKNDEKKLEVITAVYRVRLHCPQCAHDIRKPLLRTPGVHNVDINFEKDEVKVTGAIDPKKIHERLEKWSKKKVDIVSQAKIKEVEKEKDVKKDSIKTTALKVYMHCDKCERDLKTKLLKRKGIHNVKTDFKAQTITVETVAEPEKIVSYVRKGLRKHAEIVTAKKKEVEKKENVIVEEKKEKEKKDKVIVEEKKEKEKKEKVIVEEKKENVIVEEKKEKEKKEEKKKEKVVVETKSGDKIEEFKEAKKVEVKDKEGGGAPYFIHYVYAPQWFSDENPNACLIM